MFSPSVQSLGSSRNASSLYCLPEKSKHVNLHLVNHKIINIKDNNNISIRDNEILWIFFFFDFVLKHTSSLAKGYDRVSLLENHGSSPLVSEDVQHYTFE